MHGKSSADAPTSFQGLLKQRLRWDGDLLFLYGYKHVASISPRQMGWSNFIMTVVSGLFVQLVLRILVTRHKLQVHGRGKRCPHPRYRHSVSQGGPGR